MSSANAEYAQVCEQIKGWPSELRQSLAEEIARSLSAELSVLGCEWTDAKNDRRCELIDKDIQGMVRPEERWELESLTHQLRAYRRSVAPVPIEGATRLHQRILEKKRQQEAQGEAR